MRPKCGGKSGNGFIFQKINENENIKERKKKFCGRFWTQSFSLYSLLIFPLLSSRAVSLEKMTNFGPLPLKLVQPSLSTVFLLSRTGKTNNPSKEKLFSHQI